MKILEIVYRLTKCQGHVNVTKLMSAVIHENWTRGSVEKLTERLDMADHVSVGVACFLHRIRSHGNELVLIAVSGDHWNHTTYLVKR